MTTPLKTGIAGRMDVLSPAAAAIGAVNTVVVHTSATGAIALHGDNTDW